MRSAELRALLIKPLIPGGRGKECQLRLPLPLGLFSQIRGASRRAGGIVYRDFSRFAGFSISDLSKSRKPADLASSLPFSLAVPRRRLFLHPSRSRRQVLLPREMRRYRFKRTRRALLCQRPNRKSQLLRASLLSSLLRFP